MLHALALTLLPLFLAPALRALQDPSPATLLERGAYAEEHQRDFAAAEQLYRAAAEAARKAGDEALASEAQVALERLRERIGADRLSAEEELAIASRVQELMLAVVRSHGSDPREERALRELALFGPHVVDYVKLALAKQLVVGNQVLSSDPELWMRALAISENPALRPALAEFARWKDPTVRRALARNLDGRVHRELAQRLLEDPLEEVRRAALEGLARSSDDPALEPLMVRALPSGDASAIEWLRRLRPGVLESALADDSTPRAARLAVIRSLTEHASAFDAGLAGALLSELQRPAEEDRERAAEQLLQLAAGAWSPLRLELARRIEGALTSSPPALRGVSQIELLLLVSGPRALPDACVEVARAAERIPSTPFERLSTRLEGAIRACGPKELGALTAAFAAVQFPAAGMPAQMASRIGSQLTNQVHQLIRNSELDAATLAAACEPLAATQRKWFLELVSEWLDRWSQSAAARAAGEAPRRLDPLLLPVLREMARSSEERLRASAAFAFGELRDPAQVGELFGLLSDPEQRPRRAASLALEKLAAMDAAAVSGALREQLERDRAALGRLPAAVLANLASLGSEQAIALFRELWPKASSVEDRAALAQALLRLPASPEVNALLQERYDELPGHVRESVLESFARTLFEPGLDRIGRALRDPDARVREAARQAFEAFKVQRELQAEFEHWRRRTAPAATLEELLELLASDSKEVLLGAVRTLGKLGDLRAAPALARLLVRDDAALREEVLKAIDALAP